MHLLKEHINFLKFIVYLLQELLSFVPFRYFKNIDYGYFQAYIKLERIVSWISLTCLYY